MAKKKKSNHQKDVIKALHISSKQAEIERNGGMQWVAVNRPHKNKKKYNRKDNKKDLSNILDRSYYFFEIQLIKFRLRVH